jgi:hypothetical protein
LSSMRTALPPLPQYCQQDRLDSDFVPIKDIQRLTSRRAVTFRPQVVASRTVVSSHRNLSGYRLAGHEWHKNAAQKSMSNGHFSAVMLDKRAKDMPWRRDFLEIVVLHCGSSRERDSHLTLPGPGCRRLLTARRPCGTMIRVSCVIGSRPGRTARRVRPTGQDGATGRSRTAKGTGGSTGPPPSPSNTKGTWISGHSSGGP